MLTFVLSSYFGVNLLTFVGSKVAFSSKKKTFLNHRKVIKMAQKKTQKFLQNGKS
jgi:hypothetical protein